MHIKTMEGLVGARVNMNMVATPMRVYKEARRKEDKATMERALGYAGGFTSQAQEYNKKTEEGMEEDAKATKEKEKIEREKAIEKRKEEQEKQNNRITKDIAEGSKEEKTSLEQDNMIENISFNHYGFIKEGNYEEAKIYTKVGESLPMSQEGTISVLA